MIDLAQEEDLRVINYYSRTHLDKSVNAASEDAEIILARLEAILDDEWMLLMQEGKRIAQGPLPIVAYIQAKEVEVKNLRILLFGKSANMNIDEIRERMRLNYVT